MEDIPLRLEIFRSICDFFCGTQEILRALAGQKGYQIRRGTTSWQSYPGLLESTRKPHGGVTQNIQDTDPPKRYRKLGNVEIDVLSI